MAWFDFLKAKPVQAPVQQFSEKDFDAAVYDTAMRIVKESIDYSALPFISPSEPYWDDPSFTNGAPMGFSGPYGMPRRTGRGDFPPAYWDEQSLMRLINWSRWMYVNNGYARAIARTRVNYVVKNGFAFTFKPVKGASEADAETMQEWFAQWSAMVNFPLRSREMWYRRDRDGDCFVRMFRRGNGFPSLRFIEPEYVRDGKGENETTFGILTKHNDIEAVTGYRVQRDPYNMESLKDISADLIEHFKCEADSGCKRGVPILYAIQDDLYKLQKTDTNLSTLIAVVSAIAMVRKRSQNRTAIDTRNQANADYTKTDVSTGNTDYYKRYKPGSIVDIGINDEFDIPASKVNLGGVIQARQTELESCSAGVNMPYYMLSGDASNGNLSTTQVSESPAICNFESEQAECAYHLGMGRYFEGAPHGLVWKAARIAVDEGLLPPSVLDNVEIVCKGPSAVVRDRAAETNRHSIMLKDGVMTKKQYADAEPDVDYDEEGLAKEKEERQADEQAGRDHEIAMAQASGQPAKESFRESFDEEKHPRDGDGKFTDKGGGDEKSQKKEHPHIKTKEFKAWFGDWEKDPKNASKVVDKGGKPLVVFHGATQTFDKFEGKAIFFTNKPDVAASFAQNRADHAGEDDPHIRTIPVFLSIRKPFVIDANGKPAGEVQFARNDSTGYRAAIENKKYDGVIIKNTSDEGDLYIAKTASQAKSAIANSGNYDSKSSKLHE